VSPESDFFEGQKRDEAFWEGAGAAFDFATGLRTGRDQKDDPNAVAARWNSKLGLSSLAVETRIGHRCKA
jgi:hypothetical protein